MSATGSSLAEAVAKLETLLRGARIHVVHLRELEPQPGRKLRAVVPLGTAAVPELARARS